MFRDRGGNESQYHHALHPFLFPEPIPQMLTYLEIYVYEAVVNNYMIDSVTEKKVLDIHVLQEKLDEVQIIHEVEFLGDVIIDREDRGSEEEEALRIIERINLPYNEQIEKKREPESPNLYTPNERRINWKTWDQVDVMNWVKQFIFNEQHLDMIECNDFNGTKLLEFLDSDTQWKTENWPFGLFIQLKIHMNRVINES